MTAFIPAVRDTLATFSRLPLASGPTPLEALPRLGAALGVELWAKRDDCNGVGGGGNKVRKLEFLAAAALDEGCDVLLTAGALQSNHARITAAVAARCSLDCELVLTVPNGTPGGAYTTSGNRLLDDVFGATVHALAPGEDNAPTVAAREASLRSSGRRPFVIPIGGSNALGTLGYVAAALELAGQCRELGCTFDVVVLPTGSGGTHAGLVLGRILTAAPWRVIGVSVGRPEIDQRARVAEITAECAGLLGMPDVGEDDIRVFAGARGPGYAQPSPDMVKAVLAAARLEGLLLDPVYTGKAMAG